MVHLLFYITFDIFTNLILLLVMRRHRESVLKRRNIKVVESTSSALGNR